MSARAPSMLACSSCSLILVSCGRSLMCMSMLRLEVSVSFKTFVMPADRMEFLYQGE